MTLQRRRDATTLTNVYDALNRTTSITPSANGAAITYAYDNFSRLTSAASSSRTLTYAYDQLSRLLSEAQSPLGTVSYQWDLAGRRTRITWPDSLCAQYAYDLADAVTQISAEGGSCTTTTLATYAYDNLGRRTGITRGNGTSEAAVFDGASRLTDLTQNLSGTSQDVTFEYEYDATGAIVQRDASNSAYVFAPTSPATTTYADNNLNQYTSVGGVSQTHDNRGNLTTDSLGYDIFNRLISGPSSAALLYDAQGRLYETNVGGSSVTRFLYDGVQIIAEYDGSSTPALQRRFIPGPTLDEHAAWYEGAGTSDRRWLAADERGSIIALLNASGAATTINTYDEFGQRGASNAGRFQFTAAPWLPEVALYHMRARAYSPTLGRFLQTDPILHAGGMNLYAYVGNDPSNFIDPFGLDTVCIPRTRGKDTIVVTCYTEMHWPGSPPSASSPRGRRFPAADEECDILCERARLNEFERRNSTRLFLQFADTFWGSGVPLPGGRLASLCGCFAEGTQVATPDGLRPIEDIEVGDLVLAWNEETGEVAPQRVTALILPEPKLVWRLDTRDADGELETFFVTDDHPWYVEGAGWAETQHLRAGQHIETADDRGLLILDIARTDRVERTYNLEVGGWHTFLVGEGGAVVHNSCFTAAQRALQQLVNEATRGGRVPLSREATQIIRQWAREVNYPGFRDTPGDLAGNWVGGPHIHMPGAGRGGHVPITP